jgi:hypothetical protein
MCKWLKASAKAEAVKARENHGFMPSERPVLPRFCTSLRGRMDTGNWLEIPRFFKRLIDEFRPGILPRKPPGLGIDPILSRTDPYGD